MGRKTVLSCDLCGGETMGNYIIIKCKQRWDEWDESGFYSKKLYICERCQKSIRNAAVEDRKKEEAEKYRFFIKK